MSHYFTNMVKPHGDGIRAYLLHVANDGGTAVYLLDDQGRPASLVCGPATETLAGPLGRAYPGCVVVTRFARNTGADMPQLWFGWGPSTTRWRDVVASLNKPAGKKNKGDVRIRARCDVYRELGLPDTDYIVYNLVRYDGSYELTDRAKAYDARADAEREAEEA
jgi:hypothetical protein